MRADQIFVIGARVQFDGRGVGGTIVAFAAGGEEAVVQWDDGIRAVAYPGRLQPEGISAVARRAHLG